VGIKGLRRTEKGESASVRDKSTALRISNAEAVGRGNKRRLSVHSLLFVGCRGSHHLY
jgi:hypothetical protein